MRLQANWALALDAFLRSRRTPRPFQYGEWDCFQFLRLALVAMTGTDIGQGFRPYRSRFGYLRQVVRHCRSYDLYVFMSAVFDAYGVAESDAVHRGDPVVFRSEEGPALGVLSLCRRFVWALAPSGAIVRVSPSLVIASWSLQCPR